MSTISDKSIIKTMLQNGGHYEDDPVPATIYSFVDDFGKEEYAVFYDTTYNDMAITPFVREFKCLFANGMITVNGQEWILKN